MVPTSSDLVLPAAMAVAAGLAGSFAVMRRMTLAADAISHVALPGVGVALMLHASPLVGALAALLVGTLLVWAVERQTRVPTEAVIGVVFSAALAVGSMLASGEELLEALFGAPRALAGADVVVGLLGAALVIGFLTWARGRLVVTLVSPDLARTSGIDVERVNLLFLLAFALTVGLGLRYLGVLLMGSLIIIPAATAKRVARSLAMMQVVAVTVALLATLAGSIAAPLVHQETGPTIIVIAASLFFASLAAPRAD